jgi:hypothetical protein
MLCNWMFHMQENSDSENAARSIDIERERTMLNAQK